MPADLTFLCDARPPRFAFVRPVLPDGQRGIACTGAHLRAYYELSGCDCLRWERVSLREYLRDHLAELIAAGKVRS